MKGCHRRNGRGFLAAFIGEPAAAKAHDALGPVPNTVCIAVAFSAQPSNWSNRSRKASRLPIEASSAAAGNGDGGGTATRAGGGPGWTGDAAAGEGPAVAAGAAICPAGAAKRSHGWSAIASSTPSSTYHCNVARRGFMAITLPCRSGRAASGHFRQTNLVGPGTKCPVGCQDALWHHPLLSGEAAADRWRRAYWSA